MAGHLHRICVFRCGLHYSNMSEREYIPLLSTQVDWDTEEAYIAAPRPVLSYAFYTFVAFLVVLTFLLLGTVSRGRHEEHYLSTVPLEHPYRPIPHPQTPSHFWGSLEPPYPTGAWWSNMVLSDGKLPVACLPYAVAVADDVGLQVSYSAAKVRVSSVSIVQAFSGDVTLKTQERIQYHHVRSYDPFSVTMCLYISGGSMCAPLVKGSPFITAKYFNATPTVVLGFPVLTVNGKTPQEQDTCSGTQFYVQPQSGRQEWYLYSDTKITFTITEQCLTASEPITGVLRLAVVPTPPSRRVLSKYSGAYATGGEMSLSYNEDHSKAYMTFRWSREGDGSLLMLALPHHIDMLGKSQLGSVSVVMDLVHSFQSLKGPMTGIIGDYWYLEQRLTSIRWTAKRPIRKESYIKEIAKALRQDVYDSPVWARDSYTFGKQIARLARISLIAEEFGEHDVMQQALVMMEKALAPWLMGSNDNPLRYDITHGGLCTQNGLKDQNADYGNGYYNDHHFHYGYFIYAAAVLAKQKKTAFLSKYSAAMACIIGDIANMNDKWRLFPHARHKDFYDGHSWASGLFPQNNGKSQESASEAINAYYAVSLYGWATKNQQMINHGRVLLALELRSAKKYWQMPPSSKIYDPAFASNRMAGIVGAFEVTATTWFSGNVEHVHCINMMPFTPITEELLEHSFVAQEYPTLHDALTRKQGLVTEEWRGFIALDHAVVDQAEALEEIRALSFFDAGNSLSNSLYWIFSRPVTGPFNLTEHQSPAVQTPAAPKVVKANCNANPACFTLGLSAGTCCPTATGVMLDCCDQF